MLNLALAPSRVVSVNGTLVEAGEEVRRFWSWPRTEGTPKHYSNK